MNEEPTSNGEGQFTASRRGYDRDEVDAYVAQLQREIRELQARKQTPDAAVRSALERVGDEVAAVLQQAHDSADDIVAAAKREGEQHRDRATREAAHVTAVAEQRLHELDLDTDRIWAERQRMVADARDLARQLTQLADLATERFPNDGEPQAVAGGRTGLDGLNASH